MVYMYFSYSELKKVLLFYFRLVTNQLTKQSINQSNQLLSYQWYKTLETFVYIQNMQRNWSYMYMQKIVESVSIIFTERFCENDNKLWFLTVGLIIGCMQSNVNAGLFPSAGEPTRWPSNDTRGIPICMSRFIPLWESIFVFKWHNKIDTAFEKIQREVLHVFCG